MRTLLTKIRNTLAPQAGLPAAARMERLSDRRGLPAFDPGPQAVVKACTAWLCAAQDHSSSNDGGVARDYNLLKGWSSSYPETTGYIIPTMIALARRTGDHGEDEALHGRARRMLDWCVAIQFPEGGFQGGKIDSTPRVPVTFNTGQILLGLAAGVAAYGETYEDATHRAASWLRDSQDTDGCWRRHPTPFASAGDKAYETHVAWGLFEADRIAPGHGYGAAGLRQVDWALTKQRPNGWFASNCLDNPLLPLTHTIGYALRGVLEAHRFSARADLLDAAARTATGVANAVAADGYLAGRLGPDFQPGADYACLTGSAQNAHCLFLLYRLTGERRYLDAGRRLNRYVRRSISIDGPAHARGGVKGSFPVDGDYGSWSYLNWAAKFCIDANLLEMQIGDA
ncbi:hypothetical protein ACPJXG_11555 [Janthinobacterium sp. NFX145]|uniref:hypothetical protein n=1 Tax=Janthinobacterium sp. NFX145 TaxID=3415602 RepID=UPI003CC50DB7